MKYHKRSIFWCALTGLLLAVLLSLSIINNSILGCTLKTEQELQERCVGKAYEPKEIDLYWVDSPLFQNTTDGSFCLPLDPESGWQGILRADVDGEEYRLYAVREQHRQKNAAELMRSGEPLRVYAIKGERWLELPVYLSGLPVLEIKTEEAEEYTGEKINGKVRLWEPGKDIQKAHAVYNIRGNGSRDYDKKSFSLHLKNKEGEAKDMELLGLRDDDDWRLHAMDLDYTMCREKVAYDLWNEVAVLDKSPHTYQLEYLNLYKDNEYLGVYAITYRLDRKSYDLGEDAILYKFARPVNLWVPYAINTLEGDKRMTWDGQLTIVWPKEYREGIWSDMNAYAQQFLWKQGDEAVQEAAEPLVEFDNLIDVALFKQAVYAVDNVFHNMYYLSTEPGGPLYRIPYDFDMTFGIVTGGVREEADYATDILEDYEMRAFFRFEGEEFQKKIRDRWNVLRTAPFSDENIEKMFRDNFQYLQESGALAMETQRRGTGTEPAEQELEALLQAQKARMAYLDTYMQEYVPPERG